MIELLQSYPALLLGLAFILGLIVGSFLNVVILRLPVMLKRDWRKQCLEYLQPANPPVLPSEAQGPFSLNYPRSHCPHCLARLRVIDTIPLLSYLWLRGRCAHCQGPIRIRYAGVETLSALLSLVVAWKFGATLTTLAFLFLTWGLLALTFIDFDEQLLPDIITLPLMWLGVVLALTHVIPLSVEESIWGTVAGYLSLWLLFQLFRLITGKEGMGYGDFKLLALLGAWLGWKMLPLIVILSSFVGAVVGIMLVLAKKHDRSKPIPFGPYLAAAGWVCLIWGPELVRIYFPYFEKP